MTGAAQARSEFELNALLVWQVRVLAAGFAMFEAVTLVGLWGIPLGREEFAPWYQVACGAAASLFALWGALWYGTSALIGGPVRSRERHVMRLLWINVLWPALGAFPSVIREFEGELVAVGLLVLLCMVLLYGVPSGLIADALRRRVGLGDQDWSPHTARRTERREALIGVSTLAGGLTAVGGVLALAMRMLLMEGRGGAGGSVLHVMYSLATLTGVMAVGMGMGFASSIFTATIPVNTRFDRSIPLLFGPAFLAGVVGSVLGPVGGFFGAGGVLVIMCFVVRRVCPLHPEGCCERCGYALEGIAGRVCPECGHETKPLPESTPA